MSTLNINILAGPGVGKSVLAAQIFVDLKMQGVHAEIVGEVAKELLYDNKLHLTPQHKILREQYKRMARMQGKAEVVVTDGPLALSMAYQKNEADRLRVEKRIRGWTAHWRTLNILIYRDLDSSYQAEGRYQSKDEAKLFHQERIAPMMRAHYGAQLHEMPIETALPFVVERVLRERGGPAYG